MATWIEERQQLEAPKVPALGGVVETYDAPGRYVVVRVSCYGPFYLWDAFMRRIIRVSSEGAALCQHRDALAASHM